MYFEILEQLNQRLNDIGKSLVDECPALEFAPAANPDHGDLATNAAMLLAKAAKKPPRAIADEFVAPLMECPLVEKAEVAGPGFINVRVANAVLDDMLRRILANGDGYGRSQKYAGKKALVEFVSANPTGPLHVGHVRGAVVGDSAAELLKAVGYEVTREYYYNDAGVQMQMLGRSVRARYLQLFGIDAPLPENGYKGDYIRYIAAALRTAKGDSLKEEESWEPFTEFGADVLMNVIMDDLRRLRISFDKTFSERSLHDSGAVDDTLSKLDAMGATYKKDDAVWLKTSEHGDEKDRVLVKNDGEPTYVTPDIAYHCEKYGRKYDLLVNVMGHDHHSQVERVKIALKLLGHDTASLIYLLNQMVSIQRGGEKVKLSTREGQFMTMAEMIDELGADVTRYFFAQRSYSAQMTFDWDLAKQQSMENPVYYLQYLHARTCGIESNAIERGIQLGGDMDFDFSILHNDRERLLLLKLFQYPLVVMDAADKREAQIITVYLEDLAKTFHGYYQAQRVLDENDAAGTRSRCHLMLAVRQVVRNGLALLKVDAPDKM